MKHLTVVFVLLCIFACSSENIVSSVEESVKPANEVVSGYLNAQIWGDGRPLHASRTFTGDLAYSKMGRNFVLYHTRAALQNGIYGYPGIILYPSYPYRSLSEMDAKTMKEISEDIQENITFSQDELAMIAGKAKTCRESSRFESLFNEWKEVWNWSFSNNTASTRQLPQYAELKEMGKEIIPLLIEKMATEEDNFFAIRLYEDLQDNPNLIIRYANDDPRQLEGLQQTTKKTIKKWLEYNSN